MKNPLWEPSSEAVTKANMSRFMIFVNEKCDKNFETYAELHDWSVKDSPRFWELMWEFGEIKASRPYTEVVKNFEDMFNSEWFTGARLNFAENLLRFRDDRVAIIFKGEAQEPQKITYRTLYYQVARLSYSLREMGVVTGDRVAGFMPNMTETIIAMLATTSIGAIWSSCSPDFGFQGVMDRFGQIEPKVLFTANGYSYNGKKFDSLEKVRQITGEISSIEKVVIVPYTQVNPDITAIGKAVLFADFLAAEQGLEIKFEQLPFEHPLYIMYSSGTTGVPKCIVHGAGGTLIQHLKELILHTDLSREDTIFYFTTCGWMMWNWLVSSLAVGATLVLFDGSPFYPDAGVLFQLAQDEKFTVFGTSAKYIAALEQAGLKPKEKYDLKALRAILSTGSPLSVDSFLYVYRDVREDVCLSSIAGGTDIVSCFVLGNPIGPVYAGEIQCLGLGMKIEVYDETGRPVIAKKGELVCTAPFPSMPIYFWHDEGDKKYREAYFETYANVWHHGDYVEITENGGLIMYGRSDATLNPGGVRIGTAEIYRQVETMPEIVDSLVVGQDWDNDVRVILFVKLAAGENLTEELVVRIKKTIRKNTTPRHVPAKIIQVADIPYTISGKKVEIAVRKTIHGEEVLNRDALANPDSLGLYKELPQLKS